MGNNIAVTISADVADLTAKMAIARADVQATTKTLNDLARQANATGSTKELQTSLLAAGDAAAKARAAQTQLTSEMRKYAPAAESAMHGSAGVTRELLVMGRELSRGNFNRMAGSATILAGRLGVLTPAVIGIGAVVGATVAPFLAFAIAAEQGSQQAAHFQNAIEATNGYAGVSASQLQQLSRSMADWAHVGIGTANEALMKLVASGHFSGQTMLLVGEDATRMSQLTGESADKFIGEFDKMKSGVAKFAQEYQDNYHQLTTAQFEYIRTLEEQGHKEEAELALAKDVYEYLGKHAPQNLGYLESALHNVANAWSEMWDQMKAVGRNSTQDQINAIDQQIALLKKDPNAHKGGDVTRALADLEMQKSKLGDVAAKQELVAKAAGESARKQTEGVDAAAKLSEKFEASKTSGEKLKKAIADINDEKAKAIAADPEHASKYETEAAAAIAQAKKSDTPKGPKGPGQVAEWTEQLRAQEIASKNFYSDQTEAELKFWQSKIALTAAGSKDWLEVQGRIYEASKTLARQAYQDKIADLNDALTADRDNWAKEQADWQTKLAYIRSTFSEQSTEYKNAYREFERAQEDHDAKEFAAAQEHLKKQTEELKRNLGAQAKAREDDAKAAETVVKGNAGASPFGEIAAQRQLAEIHRQVTEQQIADNDTLHAAEVSGLNTSIAAAAAKYGDDKAKYQSLIDAKEAADQQYAARKQQLDAQLRMQTIQDIQAMQNAYSSYIGGTVSTTVNGFSKMMAGSMTWKQLGISIYDSVAREAEQQVTKMVTNWIVKHLLMSSAQKAQLATQTAAQTAANATNTAATLAASKAQVAAMAGLAGAAGVASFAAAPWPIDMGAPAFGAQMSAAALALGSFAVGTNVVPNDMVAQIHAGERIIPKADNDRLIDLTARGAAGGGGGGGGSAGGNVTNNHTHHWNINAADPASFKKLIMDHRGPIAEALRQHARMGGR